MYTKKEDLRPIEVQLGTLKSNVINGYFHVWFKKAGDSGEEYIWAIFEQEDGKISETHAERIRFLDRK